MSIKVLIQLAYTTSGVLNSYYELKANNSNQAKSKIR